MSLKFALLGMIAEKPGSGYTLRKRFFSNLKPTLSQVYRTLADMTQEGWIDFKKVNQDNAPNKKVYYIKEDGEQALNRWLEDAMPSKEWRTQRHFLPYLTQIWFSYRINPEEVLSNLETYKAELLNRIEWITVESKKIAKPKSSRNKGKEILFRELAIKGSTMQMDAIIKWMDYAKDKILELQDLSGNHGKRSGHKKRQERILKPHPRRRRASSTMKPNQRIQGARIQGFNPVKKGTGILEPYFLFKSNNKEAKWS
jgi:PadR family transcriptional regulator, regulatory protein AphA